MRVLLVASRPLAAARRGDQLRAGEIARALAGHELVVLEPSSESVGSTWRPPSRLEIAVRLGSALATGQALQPALVGSRDLERRVAALAPRFDLVVVMLARLAGAVAAASPTPVLVDLVDSLTLNASSRARVDRLLLRPLLRREAQALSRLERRVCESARGAAVVCERDRAELALRLDPGARERLRVVPLSVRPRRARATPTSRRIVFTGNLGYFVNDDAITSFLDGPWATLASRGFELVIAGDRPSRALRRRAARAGARLEAAPDDLELLLSSAAIAVAPTRCGSGVPVKVLEAWSLAVPVVASPFAAAGADLRHDQSGLVATSADEWVDAVTRIGSDDGLSRRLAEGGREQLERVHTLGAVDRAWRELVTDTLRDHI